MNTIAELEQTIMRAEDTEEALRTELAEQVQTIRQLVAMLNDEQKTREKTQQTLPRGTFNFVRFGICPGQATHNKHYVVHEKKLMACSKLYGASENASPTWRAHTTY